YDSPIGAILIVSDGFSLCALDYAGYEPRMLQLLHGRYQRFEFQHDSDPMDLRPKMAAYFAGDLAAVDPIPVNTGGTEFQQRGRSALRSIPAGSTESYASLAVRIGQPRGARAVGHANSLNPVAIVVPCHRVIGASHRLTGYAGGLERKRWLLDHEAAQRSLL